MKPVRATDRVVGDAGNSTLYQRPDGSRYALDANGGFGEGNTRVYGPARFDSRNRYWAKQPDSQSRQWAQQAGGVTARGGGGETGLAILLAPLVLLWPLLVAAGLLFLLFKLVVWIGKEIVAAAEKKLSTAEGGGDATTQTLAATPRVQRSVGRDPVTGRFIRMLDEPESVERSVDEAARLARSAQAPIKMHPLAQQAAKRL